MSRQSTTTGGASALPPFNPARWLEDWKDAGGSFAIAQGQLAIGQIMGAGADRRRLSALSRQLASNPGAIVAVTAEAQPIMSMEGIDG